VTYIGIRIKNFVDHRSSEMFFISVPHVSKNTKRS